MTVVVYGVMKQTWLRRMLYQPTGLSSKASIQVTLSQLACNVNTESGKTVRRCGRTLMVVAACKHHVPFAHDACQRCCDGWLASPLFFCCATRQWGACICYCRRGGLPHSLCVAGVGCVW